ncbi:hypothetical protein V2I01_35915 [Micromonospora sp. BRA006-A]|nr:hypothetical protein [Micromonospora sp. BRA006-A]
MRGDDGMHARRSGGPADRAESDRLLDAARAGSPPGADADPLTRLLSAAAGPAGPTRPPGRSRRSPPSGRPAPDRGGAGDRAAPAPAPAGRRRGGRARRHRRRRGGVRRRAPGPRPRAGGAARDDGRPHRRRTDGHRPCRHRAVPAGAAPRPVTRPARNPAGAGPVRYAERQGRPPTPPAGGASLAGHCRAYLAKPERQREKALTKPGFAGGRRWPRAGGELLPQPRGRAAGGPDDAPGPEPPGRETDD